MGISVNDLKRVLESDLGFELDDSGDHVRYVLKINGKMIARTKFSHSWRGNQQLDDTILSLQAKQIHCPTRMLKELLRGKLGKKEYFEELFKNNIIGQEEFNFLFGEKG